MRVLTSNFVKTFAILYTLFLFQLSNLSTLYLNILNLFFWFSLAVEFQGPARGAEALAKTFLLILFHFHAFYVNSCCLYHLLYPSHYFYL